MFAGRVAATGDAVEEASAVVPAGGSKTVSRWLIQQICSRGISPNSRLPSSSRTGVLPYSPIPVLPTVPPSAAAIACMP